MSINVNDPRNRPSDVGQNNDPNLREQSTAHPGVGTTSSSGSDYLNEETSESVSDYPGTSDFDDDADRRFDDEELDDRIEDDM